MDSDMNEIKPTPDPTVLTTQQLLREAANIREWTKALHDSGRGVTAEQFRSIETQLALIERQRVEQKADTKNAVDAALAAAKEAVQEQTKASAEAIGKSEALTKTQLEQLAVQFQTGITGIADKFDDMKDRVVRIETAKHTESTGRDQSRLDVGMIVGISAALIAIIGLIVTIFLAVQT